MSRRSIAVSDEVSPAAEDSVASFCEFLNPSSSRHSVDIATLTSAANRTTSSNTVRELSSDKLDTAILSLLSLYQDVDADIIPTILGQLGYPRHVYFNTSSSEKLSAIVWLVAEFDLWEKDILENITHQCITKGQMTSSFPMNATSSASSTPSSSSIRQSLNFRSLPSSVANDMGEHTVAMVGKLNHLLRKHKHLRTCRVRNTQSLVRAFRRVLDCPLRPAHNHSPPLNTATVGTAAAGAPPGEDSDPLRVGSASEAVALLRSLTDSDLASLLSAVEQRLGVPRTGAHPHLRAGTTGATGATGAADMRQSSVGQQRSDDRRGAEGQRECAGWGAGLSEESHAQLSAVLEGRVQRLRRACAQVSEGRRHEASLYRWMYSCSLEQQQQRQQRDASSHLDDDHDGSISVNAEGDSLRSQCPLTSVVGDAAGRAMLRELESAVEALVLADSSHDSCLGTAAGYHHVFATAEAELRQALGLAGSTNPDTPSAHPRSSPLAHPHAAHPQRAHLECLRDHPRTRLYRDRLPLPLPEVRPALHSLRATHRDVLQRTAQACAPYCP